MICCHGRLFLLLAVAASGAGAAPAAAPGPSGSSHVELDIMESLLPAAGASSSCPTSQELKHGIPAVGTRMPLVHRHGPCSPLADTERRRPSHTDILAADQRRVEHIHRRVFHTTTTTGPRRHRRKLMSTASALPTLSGNGRGTSNYLVTIGLGVPAACVTVALDTGSDTTWVQCNPCVDYCYPQDEPLFTPAKSSTYTNISCTSSYCSDLSYSSSSYCNRGGLCIYQIEYGDDGDGGRSFTVGYYAHDTLTLANDSFREFRFGCGEKNSGLFGHVSGVMGLGRGNTSLAMQAYYGMNGSVFAYCLPGKDSDTGFMVFGPPGSIDASLDETPMLTGDGPTFYYVRLTGIKVGGHLLPIPASVFSAAGALIDSGTTITRLPPSAYAPLRSAFAAGMARLGYRETSGFYSLDTCYNLTGLKGKVALPAVSLVFQGGASLDVHGSGILYVPDVSQACLAFQPNEDDADVAIVGSMQQKSYIVLYDIGRKVVGFANVGVGC
ncbi:hypothetical protein HU200_057191 [Digitaria exilis]|uniref:Peptidase A1 domain-containing protein n=1 Tax=Digitaria exilis TaxID=1010633 RepID=A0A835E4I8_9POAL|nr:hypothetical protein HU200_057191 [Digitaria exilis]